MPIAMNRHFNDPALGAAFSSLAQAFGPPSGSDLAGYASANAKREEASRLAALFDYSQSDDYDLTRADRMQIAAGLYNPTQSYRALDMNDATQRYGYDTQAATLRANNAADNERQMREAILRQATEPVAEGALRPGFNPADYGVGNVPAVPEFQGRVAPLNETQWQAQQNERLRGEGKISDQLMIDRIMGEKPPVEAVGPDGKPRYMSPGEAVRTGATPVPDGGKQSAAEAQIDRLTQNFLATGVTDDPDEAYNLAVGIADNRYRVDRHPITGVSQVVDIATGAVVKSGQPALRAASEPAIRPASAADEFGPQYPNANEAFGVEGAATGLVNRVMDTVGVGAPYPEVQQSQADFGVLRESLLNDIGSTYGRQPPSWLLKEIRDLTPSAGSVFEGVGGAQSKLNALGRHLAAELQNTQSALERDLSPTNQQEMEARAAGLQMGISRVRMALRAFGPQDSAPAAGSVPVQITNDADYEALPSGTEFIDPEGNRRRKP